MLPYILLILLLPVLQGCLVVQTPKCECPILALSSSNVAQNVGDHAFYKNVSGYPMKTPVVKSEDCSGSMYCEGDYSLVLFDKETVTVLGAYSADGYCNPRTQTWEVDTVSGAGLTSFDRLFGICVDYSPAKCECPVLAMSFSNIDQNVGNHVFYQNVSGYPMASPVVKTEDCSVSMYCEGDYSLVVFDKETATVFGAYSADGICNPRNQKWQVDTGSGAGFISFDRLFGICVNYAPTCGCPIHKLSSDAYAEQLLSSHKEWQDLLSIYQYSTPILDSETECPTNFTCPDGHKKIAVTDTSSYTDGVEGITCDSDKKTWTVKYENSFVTAFLAVGCYKIENCESSLPCSYKAVVQPEVDLADHPFYKTNISKYYYGPPQVIFSSDECRLDFHCELNYTIVYLDDTDQVYESGRWSMLGTCMPGSKWLVYWQYTYNVFKGICVDFTRPRATGPPSPCNCALEALDTSTIGKKIGYDPDFYRKYSNVAFYKPTLVSNIDINYGCTTRFSCPEGMVGATYSQRGFIYIVDVRDYNCDCDHAGTRQWNISVAGDSPFFRAIDYVFVTCLVPETWGIPMPTLFPPVPPACSCSAQAVLDFGTLGRFNNFLLNTDLSADQCEMTVSCENWQDIVGTLQVRLDGSRLASGKAMKAECDMDIRMWRVKVDGQNNYINATLLEYMCSYIPAKYAD